MPIQASMLGQRLKRARTARGLSLDQLVQRSDRIVSKAALSKYERGASLPRATVLRVLARVLGLPAAHFLGTGESDETAIEWSAPRGHPTLRARERQRVESLAEQRVEAFLHLLRLLHPGEGPGLPRATETRTAEDAEAAALELRKHWKLGEGPIERLVPVAEDAGVLVIESPSGSRFEALAGRTGSGFGVIVLDFERSPNDVRFNLGHALGHLLLDCRDSEPREEERLAERFAAAFLAPEPAVRRELGPHRTNLCTAELLHFEGKYGLSMQLWTRRARDLGVITESVFRQWQSWFRSQSLQVRESAEYGSAERPERLRTLCIQGLVERAIDAEWIQGYCPEVRWTAGEVPEAAESPIERLRRLPIEERNRILAAAAEKTAVDYERSQEVREWLAFEEPIRSWPIRTGEDEE